MATIDPLGDAISAVTLLNVSGSDIDVVNAARVSLNKHKTGPLDDKDKKLINFLINSRPAHTSPFEHNQLRYRVKLPIFVIREWHRHRTWSFNEVSGRYVTFGKDFPIKFYMPKRWRAQSLSNRQASAEPFIDEELDALYMETIDKCYDTYEKMIEKGVARELARLVLPVSLYTEMYATCNLHALFHFLELRLHKDAQYEIMLYAKAMLELAEPHFPVSIAAWRKKHDYNPLIYKDSQ